LLSILVAWFVLVVTFLGLGKLLASGFGPDKAREDFPETSYFFLGMSFAGILAGIWWVFFPINAVFTGLLLGLGIGSLFAFGIPRFELSFRNLWFSIPMVLILFALLMKAAAPTSFYDCGLYYVQTIRWAQEYHVVPGLANLHIRFGNISSWHLLLAAFDRPVFFGGHFDAVGELALFWFLVFHSWNVVRLEGFERYLSLGLAGFALWQTHILLSAPSPDLIVGILGMQTLWQFRKFLRLWNPRQVNQLNTRGLALFTQSIFLVQIKLSAIPFLVIALVILFLIAREKWWLRCGQLLFLALVAGASMLARNFILTGYLVYPMWQGPFQPDWSVTSEAIKLYLQGVRGFARHILSPADAVAGLDYTYYGSIPFSTWFPIWARERSWTDWLTMLSGVGGWLALIQYASGQIRSNFWSKWPLIFYTWLSGMMLLFWFSNAPDVRFGIAILGTGFSYFVAALLFRIRNQVSSLPIHFSKALLLLASLGLVWLYRDRRSLSAYVFQTSRHHEVKLTQFFDSAGRPFYTPENQQNNILIDGNQCWDSPLPCSEDPIPGLLYRGKTLQEGFRMSETQLPVQSH
jgi:hypothetical protein